MRCTSISPIKAPDYCFIEITHECNLHCQMCHLWNTMEDKTKSINTGEKLRLIDEFKNINPNGTVVFTGGETMGKLEEFFALSKKCNELGLTCSANTNASYITGDIAKKLVKEGPKYLVISLDSIHREAHDQLRGMKGTYDKAVEVIRAFSTEKSANTDSISGVYTNCIVMEQNYRELEDYVAFVKSIGANGVMFQMLSGTFGLKSRRDHAFEKLMPKDKDDFENKITSFMQGHVKDGYIMTNAVGFQYMINYVREPEFLSPEVCASGENNMMIDSYGNVQLCFNMHTLTGGKFLGNIREKPLWEMWTSKEATNARTIMSQCRRSCGMLNCHRKN